MEQWTNFKSENSFCEKYLYLDWEFIKELNNNAVFLQWMSIYNIASPLITLCIPVVLLIIPFFIIQIMGKSLSISEYLNVLKSIIPNHSICKIFTQFSDMSNGQKLYLLLSAAFYVFSIYQNILICIRFYTNMQSIFTQLCKIHSYVKYTKQRMNEHIKQISKLSKYKLFGYKLNEHLDVFNIMDTRLSRLSLSSSFCMSKIIQMGDVLELFYKLYTCPIYHNTMNYSFGFHQYMDIMYQLKVLVYSNKIHKTEFIKKNESEEKQFIKQMFYPKYINAEQNQSNDCMLSNMIITGPNASGKTTLLKTAFINILLSQQIGFGCFEKCKLKPFEGLHCYLNIPDTSGRDSLFQAEARRCKEILDITHDRKRHFCILDELYSGTNPEEAVASTCAFMKYLSIKYPRVCCLLTTHYTSVCYKLSTINNIKNYYMDCFIDKDTTPPIPSGIVEAKMNPSPPIPTGIVEAKKMNPHKLCYTYCLKEGISEVKGGLTVLQEMNYPKEICDEITISKTINDDSIMIV